MVWQELKQEWELDIVKLELLFSIHESGVFPLENCDKL